MNPVSNMNRIFQIFYPIGVFLLVALFWNAAGQAENRRDSHFSQMSESRGSAPPFSRLIHTGS